MKAVQYILIIFFTTSLICCQQAEQNKEEANDISAEIEKPADTLQEYNQRWQGVWEREGSIDPASLHISNITTTSFEFYITANDGLKSGELSGSAVIADNTALYVLAGEKDTCHISFVMQDSVVVLNQANKGCLAGSGLDFTGEYFHDRYFKEKAMQEDISDPTADIWGR